jgi:hypothetical protein
MNETDCRICHSEGIMSERGLCPCCEALAEIARKNLKGAARSKLKPPKRCPKCIDCGGPTRPVLFRPEGPWTFTCVVECYPCRQCKKLFRGDETCPHDPRVKHSVATDRVQ